MDFVKKNIFSILCGVVALIGVIAWFFPIGGMYEDLESRAKARADVYKQAESLPKAPRVLPTLVVQGDEPQPLGRFPNEKVIAVGRKATEAMAGQSKQMIDTVTKLNVHTPLTPGSLPKPQPQARLDFTYQYLDRLGWGEAGLPALLKATTPPTPEDIEAAAEKIWETEYAKQVVEIGGKNNLDQITDQFQAKVKGLPDKERQDRAAKHKIYLNEDALSPSPAIVAGQNPNDADIWFAQTALWIQEDVVNSIVAANADARDVRDAPIKHLVSLQVPFGPAQYVMAGGQGGSADAPAAIPTDANGAPAVWSASPTGRVCNELYDVIHFDLVLRVDAREVPGVLAALERNQLVTVLKTDVTAVDAAAERKEWGYVYGAEPVVQLTLQCEALFLRSWTLDKENDGKNGLMPEEVQEVVGAKPKSAEAATEG